MPNVLFCSLAALSATSGALGQFYAGQGSTSDDYDVVAVPLSDLDDSGCPVTTGIGGVRIHEGILELFAFCVLSSVLMGSARFSLLICTTH